MHVIANRGFKTLIFRWIYETRFATTRTVWNSRLIKDEEMRK